MNHKENTIKKKKSQITTSYNEVPKHPPTKETQNTKHTKMTKHKSNQNKKAQKYKQITQKQKKNTITESTKLQIIFDHRVPKTRSKKSQIIEHKKHKLKSYLIPIHKS
jgi:hypothetical protein